MEKQKTIDNIKIMVVTTNLQNVSGQEILHPEQATLVGLARVIPQEFSHINCQLVDIDLPRTNSKAEKKLLGQLLGEIGTDTPGLTIAYRRNVRWVQCFEPIALAAAAEPFDLLKKKGVYLITGGLGNIGMIFSAYLAKTCQGRLVLTGRSEFPLREEWGHYLASPGGQESIKQKIRVLQAGEAAGAEIMVCRADTADYSQMKQVIARAEERFGEIDGVIHAAGITRGRSISSLETLDKTICDEQFAPKAAGLVVLEKVTRNKKLDFCLLTSSLASVLGGLGYGAYAAANSFMDAFTQYHNRESDTRWICVNWDGWQLHEEPLSLNAGSVAKDQPGIMPHEGIEAFKRILSAEGIDCVINFTGDLQARLDQWVTRKTLQDEKKAAPAGDSASMYPRPDISVPFAEPRNRLEEMISGVWEEYFAIEKIGIHDNFFELGGDSLMGMKFVNRYKEMFGEIVHVRVLFDAPTIAELADYFSEHYPEAVARLMNSAVTQDDKSRSGRIDREVVDTIRRQIPTTDFSTNDGGKKNPRAVFILCAPRTGSTLLRVIFGGHPQFFAPPELNLLGFSTFGEIKEFRAGQPGTYYQGCSRAIMEIKGCDLQEAQDMIMEFENQDMAIKEFYRVLQEWLGERILVEKSPTYTFDPVILRRIETYFDSPLYVHLLRHPYGMIRSYEEAKLDLLSGQEFSRRVSFTRRELAELTWIISQQNIMRFLKDIPENRHSRIRFEDLVKQPQETTAALCRFLRVEFLPGEMLEPYKEQKKRMTDGIYSGGMMVGDVKFHLHKQIDSGVADTWRERYKTDFIGDITREIAGNFGYHPINDTTTDTI
jgi:NAD(P)-dependent dehydrogenase (short-subunit alcohol dehydrogenase family)/aryl carrier-like protein